MLAIDWVSLILLLIALGLAIPVGVLVIECTVALIATSPKTPKAEISEPQVAILVPAHNEATGIGATLSTLMPQLNPPDRLVVIADNCSDGTASIARQLGATVLERQDLERRGKGYALDYGLRAIENDPPDVVVLVDADCRVEPGAVQHIAQRAAAEGRPVQALYLMETPSNPSPKDSVSALAFLVKNLVRPQGLEQLGLPCLLTGTGMAFPWSVLQQVSLASGNIVEDMQLGLDLAMAGSPPLFCPEANVTGVLPQQDQAAKSQRTRWEHGHLQTLVTQVPPLLAASVTQRRGDLLAIALDLCVPPLSLLVMLWGGVTGAALLAGTLGASWLPAGVLAMEGLLMAMAIVLSWAKFGRTEIPLKALLSVPFYVLWKIPLYLAFLVRPQSKWVRTERDAVDASEP